MSLHAAGSADRPARQGREVGRDGRVQLHADQAGDVWIGGRVQPVIDGMLAWPSHD